MSFIFDYPDAQRQRRHGPRGYKSYGSYRPWLRDEFTFRCVYCLKREQWGQVTGEYDLDHFKPQTLRPDLAWQYDNLVYACRRCNSIKGSQSIDDPFHIMRGERIRLMPDGTLASRDHRAKRLILALDLNSPRLVEWRIMWLRIVELAASRDPQLLRQLTGFPVDLPDLRHQRPPGGNTRPGGVGKSWHAKFLHGELPAIY